MQNAAGARCGVNCSARRGMSDVSIDAQDQSKHWRNGLLLGTLGMLAFSGMLPATRLAVPFFGPTVLTCSRIVIAAALSGITLLIMRRWQLPERRHTIGIV